jgi:hypothetical protein
MDAVGILWALDAYRDAAGTAGLIEAEYQMASRRGKHYRHDHRQDLESISPKPRRLGALPIKVIGALSPERWKSEADRW